MKTLVMYIPKDIAIIESIEEVFSTQDIDYTLERFSSISMYDCRDWMVLVSTIDAENEHDIYASLRTIDALFRYYNIGWLDMFDNVDITTIAIVHSQAMKKWDEIRKENAKPDDVVEIPTDISWN